MAKRENKAPSESTRSSSRRIIVSVTNDLATDQRVHKVCLTLMENGFEVLLVGRKLKKSPVIVRPYKTERMRLLFRRSALFYAEYNLRLFFLLLFRRAEVLLSNDTDTLPANFLSARLLRRKLVFDAHEFFPESTEIARKPFVKWVWHSVEDLIFPHLKQSYTVCRSIAEVYKKRYGIEMQVVRNVPFTRSLPPLSDEPRPLQLLRTLKASGRKIILYQGVLNQGRGLEWMIDAMKWIDGATFCIIGSGDIEQVIARRITDAGVSDRVSMLGRISPDLLPYYTPLADVGVNLLERRGLNQYYALPNRIFDFIQAEVPVLSTDFPEIRAVVSHYGVGRLVSDHSPQALALALKQLMSEWEQADRPARFAQAKQELCWERESKSLIELYSNCCE